jgi:hypothetical protein
MKKLLEKLQLYAYDYHINNVVNVVGILFMTLYVIISLYLIF